MFAASEVTTIQEEKPRWKAREENNGKGKEDTRMGGIDFGKWVFVFQKIRLEKEKSANGTKLDRECPVEQMRK